MSEARVQHKPRKKHHIQSMLDVADDLRFLTKGFPLAAMEAAIKQKNRVDITPHLLDFLKEAIKEQQGLDENYFGYTYALYLLASFREQQAFPLMIELASLPEPALDYLLGDTLTEDLCNMLASVYNNDLAALKRVIENPKLCVWSRSACLRTLLVLVKEKVIDRKTVIDYFKTLFSHPAIKNEGEITTCLVKVACDLYPAELFEEIKEVFQNGMVAEYDANFSDVKSILSLTKEDTLDRYLTNNRHYQLINNPIKSLKNRPCFSVR